MAVLRAPRLPWVSGFHSLFSSQTLNGPRRPAPTIYPRPTDEDKSKVQLWGHCLSGSWCPTCLVCPPLPQGGCGFTENRIETTDQKQRSHFTDG